MIRLFEPVTAGDSARPLPEFFTDRFVSWCTDRGITLRYKQPCQPNQHACVERVNRTFRHEVHDIYVSSLWCQVREISAEWMRGYHEE